MASSPAKKKPYRVSRSDADRKHGSVPVPPDKRQLLTHEEWTQQYRVYEHLKDARLLSKLKEAELLRQVQMAALATERRSLRRQWKALERMADEIRAELQQLAEDRKTAEDMQDKVNAWIAMQTSVYKAMQAAEAARDEDEP